MEDLSKMELRHWANFDQTYLKDFFRDQPSTKLAEVVAERDSAIAERDAARDEKKTAYSERDAALMQIDMAYADRDVAWAERDDALAALSEMHINADDENAAMLMQLVHFAMNRPPSGSNLMCLPSNGPEIQHNNLAVTKSRAKKVMQQDKKVCKEFNVQQKSSGGAINTTKKGSKSSLRKRRKPPAQMETGEKVKQKDVFKCAASVAPHNLSSIPIPYCSCTGNSQQCYRWGSGGWQSACCTNFVSLYPLPMNQAKLGSRLAGRKMSGGAFKKLLDRLGAIGIDITKPVDLKNHWAKHGTNRYVTIK